jgi:hypothetical protein
MGWLDNLANRRRADQASQKKVVEQRRRANLHEVNRVRGMVKNLLKEVGRAYWSSVGKNCKLEVINSGLPDERWRIRHESGFSSCPSVQYWEVQLSGPPYFDGFRFCVIHDGDPMYTADTSEGELKRCLESAIARGPYLERD